MIQVIDFRYLILNLEGLDNSVRTERLDHHGMVAALCDDLNIVEGINKRIGSDDPRRVIQPGTAVKAMIMNGLGFTNNRLYLTPQFFQDKAVSRFFGDGIAARDFDDHTLGKALDEIAAYGSEQLYGELAFDIAEAQGLLGASAHLDSTSFALQGEYNKQEPETIAVTHGYSKDHRPDLQQVMMTLATTGEARIPIWIVPQNGNSSDRTSFHDTIKRVRDFQSNLASNQDFMWVADAALYSKSRLLKHNHYNWVSRVPETIAEARTLLEQDSSKLAWQDWGNGYYYASQPSNYGDIPQRWLIVSSRQAYEREARTFEKRLAKQDQQAKQACWHLANQHFACEQDACQAHRKLAAQYPYHHLAPTIEPVKKYPGKGRPAKNQHKEIVGYQVTTTITRDQARIDQYLNRKGRFIIATNQLDQQQLSDADLLQAYKDQQGVERGFRFLKDPWFMVDSFFVKKPSRIEALMMVMTLSLLVYNFAQFRIRQELAREQETLPDQKGRSVTNPTIRWLFQLMEGASIVAFYDPGTQSYRGVVTNMTDERIKVVRLTGRTACKIYGIPI